MIGILAGMGPRSTAPFVELVIEECANQYGAKEDMDFPEIMIYSLPTPFYVDHIDHELMKKTVLKGLQRLEEIGVDFIAMPCNTVHAYFDFYEANMNIPVLHIIESTINYLPKEPSNVAVLATRHTIEANLYQDALDQTAHSTFIPPQELVDELIQRVKDVENPALEELKKWLSALSIDTIILGCTDLVSIRDQFGTYIVVESSECLAKDTIHEYLELR